MPMEQTDAIVLRTIEFSESSLIVTLMTRDFGKVSGLAKGARRPKSAFEGSLDLLAVCRVVLLRKSSDALDLITESKLQRRFRVAERGQTTLTERLQRLYGGYYVAEMVRHWTDEGDPHPDLFDLTERTIGQIDGDAELATTVTFFELQALRILGLAPRTDRCADCGGEIIAASRVAFGLQAGGVLCTVCAAKHRQTVVIRRAVLERIQSLLEQQPAAPRRIESEIYGELRAVLNRYIKGMLGREPRMQPFLPTRTSDAVSIADTRV
ncbi:MAG: DNA repair protein RecO [Pirellulaceae bacterium]